MCMDEYEIGLTWLAVAWFELVQAFEKGESDGMAWLISIAIAESLKEMEHEGIWGEERRKDVSM